MRDGIENNARDGEGLAFGLDTPPRVSRSSISGTRSLRRLPPRVQRPDRDARPTPAFWGKRLQAIEKKGGESKKERKEILRGGKLLKDRGLESERRRGPGRSVRDNTRNHTTDLDVCQ